MNRSIFHTHKNQNWLQKRHKKSASHKYLMKPDELKLEAEVKRVFEAFDADGSLYLDFKEMEEMFQHFNFDINMDSITDMFRDITKQEKGLDFKAFYKSLVDENLAVKFNKMIKTKFLDDRHHQYVPLTLSAMITYLCFHTKREQILNKANSDKL